MGAGHSHTVATATDVRVGRTPRRVLVGLLVLAAFVTAIGVWQLWPGGSRPGVATSSPYAAQGVTFPIGTVERLQPACGSGSDGYRTSATCGNARIRLSGTPARSVRVTLPPEVARSGLQAGDSVQLVRTPGASGSAATFTYFATDRHVALFWFALVFAVAVVAVARRRGLMALIALGFAVLVVRFFMIPALLGGEAGVAVALAGASAIMFVVLYLTHGLSMRTSSALAGTLCGVGVTALVGHLAIGATRLTGVADETGALLAGLKTHVDFAGLLVCGLILAGLGVLNDVTITQSSAVWELRAAAPTMSRRRIFSSAMRIGRDHIASTIYTIVFAYAGASIVVLLLLSLYDRPFLSVLSSEDVAEEVVRTLASAMGLVLAVPITTAIAAAVASPGVPDADDHSAGGRFGAVTGFDRRRPAGRRRRV